MTLQEVETLATSLLKTTIIEGKNLWDEGWKFKFIKTRFAMGRCKYSCKIISYSIHFLLNTEEQIKDTLLHEMAHAYAGYGNGHNNVWKAWEKKLGAKPERCGKASKESEEYLANTAKYIAQCPQCKHKYYAQRKKKNMQVVVNVPQNLIIGIYYIFLPNKKANSKTPVKIDAIMNAA